SAQPAPTLSCSAGVAHAQHHRHLQRRDLPLRHALEDQRDRRRQRRSECLPDAPRPGARRDLARLRLELRPADHAARRACQSAGTLAAQVRPADRLPQAAAAERRASVGAAGDVLRDRRRPRFDRGVHHRSADPGGAGGGDLYRAGRRSAALGSGLRRCHDLRPGGADLLRAHRQGRSRAHPHPAVAGDAAARRRRDGQREQRLQSPLPARDAAGTRLRAGGRGMTAIPVIQPSFAAGELSPFLYGRVDLAKFHVGARTLQNFFVHAHGGVSNRPGTRFIGEVDDSSARHRLIPFQFRTLPEGQTYVLVFGDKTMQVAMQSGSDWGFVTEEPRDIQAITRANPGVIEIDGHGFANGDRVALSGIVGMTQLDSRTVTVTTIDSNHVSIGLDTSGFDLWLSGGTAARLFSLPTPYAAGDLPLLKYVQSADTMTLTHPTYSARKLTRAGHALWSLTPITFAPTTQPPTGLASTSGGSAAFVVVTSINDATGEESLPSAAAGSSSGGGGAWNWTGVPGCTNYNVYKLKGSVYGFVAQVQQPTWTDSNLDPDISNTPPGSRTPFGTNLLTGATVVQGGSGYNSPTGKVIDGGRMLTTVSFTLSGSAIASATLADTTQQASANAFLQITDGSGAGAVLQPVFANDAFRGI